MENQKIVRESDIRKLETQNEKRKTMLEIINKEAIFTKERREDE